MQFNKSLLTPVAYALVIFGLFLPFCHIRCNGIRFAEVQGTDMILNGKVSLSGPAKGMAENFGEEMDEEEKKEDNRDRQVKTNFWIVLTLLAVLAGLGVYFGGAQPQEKIQRIVAICGIAFLLIFLVTKKNFFNKSMDLGSHDGFSSREAAMMKITVTPAIGFWISLAGFAAALGLSFWREPENTYTIETPETPEEPTLPQ